jgi:hypothetical protein
MFMVFFFLHFSFGCRQATTCGTLPTRAESFVKTHEEGRESPE